MQLSGTDNLRHAQYRANGSQIDDPHKITDNPAGITTLISTSRTALATDDDQTFELAADVTYTLSDTIKLPAGVILIGPASGTATLAVTGSATTNGATSAITIAAGEVLAAVPRASNTSAFVVKKN